MWGDAYSHTVVDTSSGYSIAFDVDGADRRAFVYAPMGRMADCDVMAGFWLPWTTTTQIRIAARVQDYDPAAPERGYFLSFDDGLVTLGKYDPSGTYGELHEAGVTFNASTWMLARLLVQGNAIQAKVWEGNASDEPADWMLSATDSDYAEGYAGIGLLGTNGIKYMDYFRLENLD